VLSVPLPISAAEIEQYARLLHLAPPQEVLLRQAFESRYLAAREREEQRLIPALVALSQEAARLTAPDRFSPMTGEAFAAFVSAEQQASRQMEVVDAAFFSEISGLLADSQLELLPRVRDCRARKACACNNRIHPAAAIDLIDEIQRLNLDVDLLERLDPVLSAYESELTRPFVDLEDEIMKARVERLRVSIRRQFNADGSLVVRGTPEDSTRREEAIAALKRLGARQASLEKRIVNTNIAFLGRFEAELPSEHAGRFRTSFLIRAYPSVYPDPAAPTQDPVILAQELGAPEATAAAVAAIWTRYREAYAAQCRELQRLEDDRWTEIAESGHRNGQLEHQAELNRLLARRRELNEQVRRQVVESMPVDLAQAMEKWAEPAASQ
jgi:hypothetical protein